MNKSISKTRHDECVYSNIYRKYILNTHRKLQNSPPDDLKYQPTKRFHINLVAFMVLKDLSNENSQDKNVTHIADIALYINVCIKRPFSVKVTFYFCKKLLHSLRLWFKFINVNQQNFLGHSQEKESIIKT